jgi:serine/threonine protein kinase
MENTFGEADMMRYEKQVKKGFGTYGEVFCAIDLVEKKKVALKKMHLEVKKKKNYFYS